MGSRSVSKPPAATSEGKHAGETLLHPEEHVLATLEADGSRRWLFPRVAIGNFWKSRRVVAWLLIAFFTIVPHLRFRGLPPVLLDIPARRFTILGYTFLPTDTLLMALLMVSAFLTLFLVTALFGRVWCGWGCPQTVYMEFLIRPIDRLFQGTSGKGGTPKHPLKGWRWWARGAVVIAVCAFLTHTFLLTSSALIDSPNGSDNRRLSTPYHSWSWELLRYYCRSTSYTFANKPALSLAPMVVSSQSCSTAVV